MADLFDQFDIQENQIDLFDQFDIDSAIEDKPETLFIESTGETIQAPPGFASRLASFGKGLSTIGTQGFKKGQLNTRSLDIGFDILFGNDDPALEAELISLQRSADFDIPAEGFIENAVRATAEFAPTMIDMFSKGIERGVQGAAVGAGVGFVAGNVTGIGLALPEELVTVPGGALLGFAKGAKFGVPEEGFQKAAGGSFLEFRNIKDVDGDPLDIQAVRIMSFMIGTLNTGLDVIPLTQMINVVPGSDKLFKKLGAKVGGAIGVPTTKKAIIAFAKNISKITATEVTTEAAQELITISGGETLKFFSEGEFEFTTKHKVIDRLIEAAQEAALATPGISAPFTTSRLVADLNQARIVSRDAKAVADGIKNPKIKEQVEEAKVAVAKIEEQKQEILLDAEPSKQLTEKLENLEVQKQEVLTQLDADLLNTAKEEIQPPKVEVRKFVETAEKGRIRKIDEDIAVIDKQIDANAKLITEKEKTIETEKEVIRKDIAALETEKDARIEENKPVKAVANKIDKLNERLRTIEPDIKKIDAQNDKLIKQRDVLDAERAGLLLKEKPVEVKKKVTVKAKEIVSLAVKSEKEKIRAFQQGIRSGIKLAKTDVKAAQTAILQVIKNSGLPLKDQAKFLASVKNIQTSRQALKKLPVINARISALLEINQRKSLIESINKIVKATGKSEIIAIDFVRQIQDFVSEIDLKGRSEESINRLENTLEFFKDNPDLAVPEKVLKKLSVLNKKPVKEITTGELEFILDEVTRLTAQGKTKFKLLQSQQRRLKERRLIALEESVPINTKEIKRNAVGERLTVVDEMKNKFTEFANKARDIDLALNPMDVFFDMLDGDKSYKGPNHRIFKQTIDKSFGNYLNLKEDITRAVKKLTVELDMKPSNFERIGVFAAAQQEGGIEKLKATGITQAEIEGLKLTKDEVLIFNLMRDKLDKMFPAINKVMIDVYNKDVSQIKDYFPFMTDFDAMNELNIEDQLGDNIPQTVNRKDVQRGFTKVRVGGKQKIKIDALQVFLRHVDNASYLVEMGSDIKSLGELALDESYADSVGNIGQEYVVEWVDLLARKGSSKDRVVFIDTLRRNAGFAVLGFKLSTVLIQPTALADGAAIVGGNYVRRGVQNIATDKQWRLFLKENLPEIRERVGDDPAYLDLEGDGFIGKAQQAGFWALKNVDLLTASSVASGAYIKSVEQRGGVVDLSNPDPVAIAEAQLMMRRTQSSAFAKDVPPIISQGKLTGNASVDRVIFQFQSFMINKFSIFRHDLYTLGVKQGKTKQALNAATWLILAGAFELGTRRLSKEILSALLDDDLEPWEDTIEEEAIRNLVGNVPIISQGINAFGFGSTPAPALDLVNNVFKRGQFAIESKSADKKFKNAVAATLSAVGVGLGIPGTVQAEQITRKLLD